MAVAMIGPKFYGWDKNGKPLAFGKLYTKLAGTDIDKDTWTNEDQQVENSNPVILNGEGYADVYLSGSYKMILTDADDNEIWSQDPVSSSSSEEWVNCQAATYVSPTSFKVTGDYTDIYSDSRAVRLDQGEADYQYSFVSSSSFSGGETTVILLESIVLVGLTEVCSSIVGSKSIPAEGVYYFDTIQNLLTGVTATSLKEGDIANIVTFYEDGISGGGTFRYNSTKDKTDHNGGTIIDPGIGITPGAAGWWTSAAPGVGVWERVDYGDPLDLRWFGFGESVTASLNTSAWQAALDLAESYALLAAAGTAIGPGKTVVYIPDGVYSYGTTGVTKALGVSIIGLSREGVRLTYTGIGKAIDVTLNIGDIDESLIDKFTLECSDAATDGIYVSRAQELIIQNLRVDNDNGGGSGIQFYSHCHHSKVLNSRVFGGDYGVRNQRNAAEGRNNSCEFKGLWLDGGISSFFDDDCYATQLINCKSDSRSPSVADINFKNSRSFYMQGCYFEPEGGKTVPYVLVNGDSVRGSISDGNRFGMAAGQANGAIQLSDTAEAIGIDNNTFYGSGGGVVVHVENGIEHTFLNNYVIPGLLTNGIPDLLMDAGTKIKLNHDSFYGLVDFDGFWGLSNDILLYYNLQEIFFDLARWDTSVGDSAPTIPDETATSGVCKFTTDGVINHTSILQSFARQFAKTKSPILKFQAEIAQTTDVEIILGFDFSPNHYVYFSYNSGTDTNWMCNTYGNDGAETETDSGVAVVNSTTITFEIIFGASSAKFYIDGVLVATNTTDLTTSALYLFYSIEALVGSAKTMRVYNTQIRQDL